MRVLGIESSCDETAAALVEDGTRLLATSLASSAAIHARYGGVVPEVAAREHTMAILPVVEQVLQDARLDRRDVDAVAVTEGPGLLGALLVGVTFAKGFALGCQIPVVGVHHLEAHLYANALVAPIEFPALGLLVSGGHTSLVLWKNHGEITVLGETRDDAAGEAFDKGARALGLSYPGGPEIEKLAATVEATSLHLPIANLGSDSLDFSFSGVKTATSDLIRSQPHRQAEIAYALQVAVVEALVRNVSRALKRYPVDDVYLAGGVTANAFLRQRMEQLGQDQNIRVHIPPVRYCTDNAAMVASLGYYRWARGIRMSYLAAPRVTYPLGQQ
ncbi:MAG: tRNA (adenosine(37)-N6)-threonylcarbamoyltransferase complex transferase subunit TsaD [Sulfobacillus benefaciens]|uniref:tRNA N6-adenosine threonylcarbamoyltransferase n=1 Tax=Sulfobacillus benefaciens TaxID=453960 RepID=A0A2T2XEK1_9FIRM|nr:MAG: tRNA (adenosine(37)-N6)-threonylcarbamoyltransferase complex transferase subunit TsaD [Sulfobacillus benefaciens]